MGSVEGEGFQRLQCQCPLGKNFGQQWSTKGEGRVRVHKVRYEQK